MNRPDLSGITRAIQVRHIAVPIDQTRKIYEHEKMGPVTDYLLREQFTHTPVFRNGKPVGLVAADRRRPRMTVGSQMRDLDESLMVSADTSLSDLPAVLADEPFLFVFEGRRISGFVCPSDMGSAPARTHFYLQLSQLEILLAQLIRRDFPDQDFALSKLTDRRQLKAREVQAELEKLDEALDLVAAVALIDLIVIAGSLPGFREEVTKTSGRPWKWVNDKFGNVRNDVMHPVRDFAKATQAGMKTLVDFETRVRSLTLAAEKLLDSDSPDIETAEA